MAKKKIVIPKYKKDRRCIHYEHLGEDNYCEHYPDMHRTTKYTYIQNPEDQVPCIMFKKKV